MPSRGSDGGACGTAPLAAERHLQAGIAVDCDRLTRPERNCLRELDLARAVAPAAGRLARALPAYGDVDHCLRRRIVADVKVHIERIALLRAVVAVPRAHRFWR